MKMERNELITKIREVKHAKASILTDKVSRDAFMKIEKPIHNLDFPWGIRKMRNIAFKVGNIIYLLHNHGRNPFTIDKVTSKSLLLYPDKKFWDVLKGNYYQSEHTVPENWQDLNKNMKTKFVTIRLSEEIPRYFIVDEIQSKDIRLVLPIEIYHMYFLLACFDINYINHPKTIIVGEDVSALNQRFLKNQIDLKAQDAYFVLKETSDKFTFIVECCSTIDPLILRKSSSYNIFYIEHSTITFSTGETGFVDNPEKQEQFKKDYFIAYYREFEEDYYRIDLIKHNRSFFPRCHNLFKSYLDGIRNFRYICKKMRIYSQDKENYLIYEVMRNEANFECLQNKIGPEITELNAAQLIALEEQEKLNKLKREKVKLEKKINKLEKNASQKIILYKKEVAKQLANEAKEFISNKNKLIKSIENKIINEIIFELGLYVVDNIIQEISSEVIQENDIAILQTTGLQTIAELDFYDHLLLC